MSNKKDFATSTIAVEPTPQTSGTSITIQTGHGARMPAVPFKATTHPDGELPTLDNAEKIIVTAVSGDDLTITRAQGGTTAKYISSGWRISNTIFEDDFDASNVDYDNSTSGLTATNAQDAVDEVVVGINDKVPTSRTVNGHALSGDVTVTKSDVGLGSVPNTDFTSAVSANTSKLSGIEDNAQVNVNSDWNATSGDAEILNKPALGTAAASNTGDFATASQGTKADTAVQSSDLATVATSGDYTDLTSKPTIPTALSALSGTSDDVTQGTSNLYLTSSERTKLTNTSGTNTGDETTSTIKSKLGITTLSGSNTGDQTSVTGNAGTATKLATARNINGVAFDGTANITVADSTKVPTTRTVNGKALSANITLAKADVGLGNVTNDVQVKASDVDTTTTLGTSDAKVPSQKAVKTYVDTNNTAALTSFDGTYFASLGISGVTETQSAIDDFGAAMTAVISQIQSQKGVINVSQYDSPGSYTWTKPDGAQIVEIFAVGGGGGGGKGGTGAAGTTRAGGGGGGAGGVRYALLQSYVLSATETVTVGAGGASGTDVSWSGTNVGGATSFGTKLVAGGGGGGFGGASFVSGYHGTNGASSFINGMGGDSVGGTFASSGGDGHAGGGAPGGATTSANARHFAVGLGGAGVAGAGGTSSNSLSGTNGVSGGNGASGSGALAGSGGGGGASANATSDGNGGTGGNGGSPGGGGGGGGSGTGTGTGGNGGTGGGGAVLVVTYG